MANYFKTTNAWIFFWFLNCKLFLKSSIILFQNLYKNLAEASAISKDVFAEGDNDIFSKVEPSKPDRKASLKAKVGTFLIFRIFSYVCNSKLQILIFYIHQYFFNKLFQPTHFK